jgi:hypothetical protein
MRLELFTITRNRKDITCINTSNISAAFFYKVKKHRKDMIYINKVNMIYSKKIDGTKIKKKILFFDICPLFLFLDILEKYLKIKIDIINIKIY